MIHVIIFITMRQSEQQPIIFLNRRNEVILLKIIQIISYQRIVMQVGAGGIRVRGRDSFAMFIMMMRMLVVIRRRESE